MRVLDRQHLEGGRHSSPPVLRYHGREFLVQHPAAYRATFHRTLSHEHIAPLGEEVGVLEDQGMLDLPRPVRLK